MDTCEKHPHERGAGICGRCGGSWCNDCLVYTHGSKKPPMCMGCAMYAGGVRSAATRPAMPKRELKALLKAAQAEAKAAAKAGGDGDKTAEETAEAETAAAVEVRIPKPVVSDWETPWWEDRQPTLAD